MTGTATGAIGVVTPDVAYAGLGADPGALLVDVRTRAEWAFVGAADLSGIGRAQCFIEWVSSPAMMPNGDFIPALAQAVGEHKATTVYMICRSGARSHDAAVAAAAHFAAQGQAVRCVNVAEGFEGGLDSSGHRGAASGWKARGLPWRQN